MAGQNKIRNTKTKIGFRRRLTLYYLRFLLLIKILALIAIILLSFTHFLDVPKKKLYASLCQITREFGFALANVVIEGQKNISSDDITRAINAQAGASIYSLNIDDIRKRLEDDPWIKAALVERRLPDTLYIALVERQPVAIWQFQQKLYLVDEDGTRITAENIEKFDKLLHVVGHDANIYARSLLEELEKHPSLAKKVISAVRYGQRRWDLNLEQNIKVKMPEKDFNEAYDYLNSLNKESKLFDQNYKTINLIDPTKYCFEKYNP